ncbi:MAG TPA: alpha/beta hydrolase-fold protein, partial [Actinomycetota bacterium]|nr:alpha/beta hydrolase-fold protein [Actinomycetota bacterium]
QEPASSGNGAAPDVRATRIAATVDGNLWNESAQARALTRGDVSEFSWRVRWSDLAEGRSTPQPRPTGYSVRWYATTLNLGQGVVHDAADAPQGDLRPNFLSRIQPYAVYVPTTYDPKRAWPLTWVLHSLGVNHNQYAATAPRMQQQECEDRRSICATILGFGPDGWYFDEAEVDFWQVWHQLALAYRLDPDRTVISGYSMGGYGSYKLGLEYPDLFAKAMPLAGPPACGARIVGPVQGPAVETGSCAADGDTTPLVPNARWMPYVIADGAVDELVPITGVLQQVQAFTAAGNRYRFHFYPAEDHMVYAIQDGFSTVIADLGRDRRITNPARITYAWYPNLNRSDFGIGPTGAYWIRDLRGRDASPGAVASLDALSEGLPNPPVRPVREVSAEVLANPTPDVVITQRWVVGDAPAPRQALTLDLTNVGALRVDLRRAAITSGMVKVNTDGDTTLRLSGLRPGTSISWTGGGTTVGPNGVAAISLQNGLSLLRIG